MSERLLTHVDFRDKILKIIGGLAKVRALQQNDPSKNKELLVLVRELSRVRKWLKFLRILRGLGGYQKSLNLPDSAKRAEAWFDLLQMITEDINNLHVSGIWSGLLGLPKIPGLSDLEDRAWFLWSVTSLCNSVRGLRVELAELGRLEKGGSVQEVKHGEDGPEKNMDILSPLDKAVLITQARQRLLVQIISVVKFACESGDSAIALTPKEWKQGRENQLVLISAGLSTISAFCSLHKFLS